MILNRGLKKIKKNLILSIGIAIQNILNITNIFQKRIIENIDDVTDEITDLLGNPQDLSEFQRRGLIIGDVQSGKTPIL